MNGILLVDKPVGWTSHDVVAKVRSELRRAESKEQGAKKIKVGHVGTLDPLASGLLVLLVGDYTKRAAEFSKLDKTYEVEMTLGYTSTTGDAEGDKKFVSERVPSSEEILSALKAFIGEIMQTPPAYSAIKVNGQRAYKLARAGKEVKLEPRKVKVYSIQLTAYSYPVIKFTAKVSSGTYIRSLVEDIGQKLGTGAYMSALSRTQVGNYRISKAVSVDDLTASELSTILQ